MIKRQCRRTCQQRVLAAAARVGRVLALITSLLAAPSFAAAQFPNTPAGARLQELVRAYNSGTDEALISFAKAAYGPTVAADRRRQESVAAYWRSVYREFGPVDVHSFLNSSDQEAEVWARGRWTHVWMSLLVEVGKEPPHWVTAGGVGKGTRPQNASLEPPTTMARLPRFLGRYLQMLESNELFSGVVVMAVDGKVTFEGAYGQANRGFSVPNRLNTRFDLASVSKLFTALLVAKLAETGKLSFSDPIQKYLPEYPPHISNRVTINHLLTHTSGIELDDDKEYANAAQQALSLSDLYKVHLKYLKKLPNYDSFKPPGSFDYTNEGYDLLGIIAERAGVKPFDELLNELIFRPAGMIDTVNWVIERQPERAATGYTTRSSSGRYTLGPLRNNLLWMSYASTPAGEYFSTGPDMLRFSNALFAGKIVTPATLELMLVPRAGDQGLGFQVAEIAMPNSRHVKRVGHSGGLPGASARFDFYPDQRTTVIVLSNYGWVANNIADLITEVLAASPAQPPQK